MVNPFEQFVEAHYQAAYRFALSLCGHEADARDLTQQAFWIAQTKLAQVREEEKQRAWLFTVLRREFGRGWHPRTRHQHQPWETAEAELPHVTVDHAARIDARSLVGTLRGLEEHYRVPLNLFYFEQLSYKEIAVIIEAPVGTVMSRLARGKRLLRQAQETGANGDHSAVPCKISAARKAAAVRVSTPSFS